MSAIRRNDRRTTRNQLTSPYSRSKQPVKKPSTWRMPSWLSFLNPLISRDSNELDEDDDFSQPDDATDDSEIVVERTLNRPKKAPIQAPEHTKTLSSRKARSPQEESSFDSNTVVDEPAPEVESSVEKVYKFLNANHNRKLNKYEVRGIIHELEKSVTEEKSSDEHEPFRFSTSPSPGVAGSALFSIPNSHINETPARPRTLPRNPNGTYQYRGVGSARPRPRHSPPTTIRLPSPTKTPGDGKRRRTDIGGAPSTSSSSTNGQRVPFPISAPTSEKPNPSTTSKPAQPDNGTKKNGLDAPPAIAPRAARLLSPQPTTPAHPSPLRQAWNAGTPSDTSDSPPASVAPARSTRAAEFMTELIEKVTPAQRPAEIVNPYQSASPVPLVARKPRKKPSPANVVQSTQAAKGEKVEVKEKKKEKEVELSTQAIIEATVPKGSKRSRPPPELVRSLEKKQPVQSQPARRTERLKSPEPATPVNGISQAAPQKAPVVLVEEVSDDDESPAKKRKAAPKKPDSAPKPRINDVIVEEIAEDIPPPMLSSSQLVTKPAEVIEPGTSTKPAPSTREGSPEKPAGRFNTSVPKEPSKLRFSVAAEGDSESDISARKDDEDVEEKSMMVQDSPIREKKVEELIKSPLEPVFKWDKPKEDKPARPAPAIPTPALAPSVPASSPISFGLNPTPAPTIPIASSSELVAPTGAPTDAKAVALLVARSELPVFDFKTLAGPPKLGESSKQVAQDAAKIQPVTELPVFKFLPANDKGKGKAPATAVPAAVEWTCDVCMLKNPGSATEKCTICDAPKLVAPKPKETTAFNWAAAGAKVSTTVASGEWTCDTCMLKNPSTATEKCTVCDAPKPGAAIKPSSPISDFNWAAAGSKPAPSATALGEWTCGTCMLKNPPTATAKCTVCDEPKPGASAAAPAAPAAFTPFFMPAPPQAFDWTAAGIKAPATATTDDWTCGTCGLKNAASATVKCTICDSLR